MDLSKMRTDRTLETEGVWIDLQPGVRVKQARWNNPTYQNRQFELLLPYRDQFADETAPPDLAEDVAVQCMAECILLDWEGIEWDEQPLEPTYENRLMVLREVSDFRNMLVTRSRERNHFLMKTTNESMGKGPSSSHGKRGTASLKSGSGRSETKATLPVH
jgi:hypothetical protein